MAVMIPKNSAMEKLAIALGIPEYFQWFELRVAVDEIVSVKCEFLPEPFEIDDNGDIVSELAEYELVKKNAGT